MAEVGESNARLRLKDYLRSPVSKAYFVDLESGEQKSVLFNPTQFEQVFRPRYSRHSSPGLSHQRLHYVGSDNVQIPLTLYFDQLAFDEARGVRAERDPAAKRSSAFKSRDEEIHSGNDVQDWQYFLESLVTPRRSQRLASASPPPVLFVWPYTVEMRARVTGLAFRFVMFSSENDAPMPRIFTADMAIEEDVPQGERLYSADVRRTGTRRAWGIESEEKAGG